MLRRESARDVPAARAGAAVRDLGDAAVVLFPSLSVRERAWALRRDFTIADAIFLALAEHLGEPLATKDAGLAHEAVKHTDAEIVILDSRAPA